MIGSLKKLEILSFYHSFGDYSPIEFTNLCNLRSLDLRFRELSGPLLLGVLSGMKKLEELYLKCFNAIKGEDAKIFKNLVCELEGNGFINLKTLILSHGDFEYLIDATNTIPGGTFGKLEFLELNKLPKLREICNGNIPRVVIEPSWFCNLLTVNIFDCESITSLFQESVAKCLVNLQSLTISSCQMLEVVSTDARENEVIKTCEMLVFPKLKIVDLKSLSRFKSFTFQSNSDVSHALFNQVNFPNMEWFRVDDLGCIVTLLGKEMQIQSLHKLALIAVFGCSKLLAIAESDSIQLLQNLERLTVWKCNALDVLFDFEGIKVTNDDEEIDMLGRLIKLWLKALPKLVHITRMVPKKICVFQNLTTLNVANCNSLKCLFSPSMVISLAALEDLSITCCEALEEIIGREEEKEGEENNSETRNIVMDASTPSNLHHFTQVVSMDAKRNEVIDMLEFPKLESLVLYDLISFKSFRSESNDDVILRMLFNQVTLPNMNELVIDGLDYIVMLVNMRAENSRESLQNLEILEVYDCKALEVLFEFECLIVPEDHAESVFGRLRSLRLKYLDKLAYIIGTVPNGIRVFENLTSIVVERCGILKYLFLPSMANSLVALEVLKVSDCESIKAIVGKEEEEEGTSEIRIIEAMKTRIVFPKLNRLRLKDLSSIQMFCSQNYDLVWPLLKDSTIKNCPMMENLSPLPVSAPKLDISNL